LIVEVVVLIRKHLARIADIVERSVSLEKFVQEATAFFPVLKRQNQLVLVDVLTHLKALIIVGNVGIVVAK